MRGIKIKKRTGSPYYQYSFTVSGTRFRGSTQESERAGAFDKAVRIYRQEASKINGSVDLTLDELFTRYYSDISSNLKSWRNQETYAAEILKYFGKDTPVGKITQNWFSAFVAHLKKKVLFADKPHERKLSASTINHYISAFRKPYRTAKSLYGQQIEDIDFSPHRQQEPDSRIRWITVKEAEKLIKAAPPHLKPIIKFALYTGARRGNILNLTWKQVDLGNKLITFYVKSTRPGGKFHIVPITDPLQEMLKKMRPKGYSGEDLVFTYKGNPIRSVKRSFATACTTAKIKKFKFHDLRHTSASWLVQENVAIERVKDILGHSHISTTLKYAHHRKEDIKRDLNRVFGTKLTQKKKGKPRIRLSAKGSAR